MIVQFACGFCNDLLRKFEKTQLVALMHTKQLSIGSQFGKCQLVGISMNETEVILW